MHPILLALAALAAQASSSSPASIHRSMPVAVSQPIVIASETRVVRIAINTASTEDLQRLPGIGPRKAELILAARAKRAFRKASDLRRIKGFGIKTIHRLEPMLDFSAPPPIAAARSLDSGAAWGILHASLPTNRSEAP